MLPNGATVWCTASRDTGQPALVAGTTCANCDVRLANGNAASVYYVSSTCPAGENECYAPVGLTSWGGSGTWQTFAHEVGHTFGASHTFGLGGLMDYNDDTQFYDNGQVCSYVNSILARTQTCLQAGNAVCGDGTRAYGGGEECDDGNTNSGDGCSSTCTVECDYVLFASLEPLPWRHDRSHDRADA